MRSTSKLLRNGSVNRAAGRLAQVALLALGLLAVAAPASPAAAAGWHRVTPPGGANIDEVGLARTADGALHAAWVQDAGGALSKQDLATRTIAPSGDSVGPVSLIASGWGSLSNPALVASPGGIRAFFGGIRTTESGQPNDNLNTAFSSDGGAGWALQIGNVTDAPGAFASETSATLLPSGVPLITGAGTGFNPYVTTGLVPGAAIFWPQTQLSGNYGYDSSVATDSAGRPYLAWASNAAGDTGIWAQQLTPSGGPATPPQRMPLPGGGFSPESQHTPLAAGNGGVYIAYPAGYPTTKMVKLWKVGTPKARQVAKGHGDHVATVSGAPDGRLWVVWAAADWGSRNRGRIQARRSNKAGTRLGALVKTSPPHGTHAIFRLDASAGKDGGVDVLPLTDAGSNSTWVRHLLPGLTLKAKPSHPRAGTEVKLKVRVLDAGDPVAGAKVTVAGHKAKTDKKGRARIKLSIGRHARKLVVKAAHGGYAKARKRLRVKR